MVGSTFNSSNVHEVVDKNSNSYRNIVMDAMGMNHGHADQCPIVDEEPNTDATRLFDLLKDSDKPLWDSCTNHNKLSTVAYVFNIKSDHGFSETCYDRIVKWTISILLEGNKLKKNFYTANSMMKPLDLGYQTLTFVKTSACCTTLKIQSLSSIEHVDILVINI
jgi:hypothetical protein